MILVPDPCISKIYILNPCWEYARIDTMAEWSKAVALGAIPKGRGFEPHWCHFQTFEDCFFCRLAKNDANLAMPLVVTANGRVLPYGATVAALNVAQSYCSAVSTMMKSHAYGS